MRKMGGLIGYLRPRGTGGCHVRCCRTLLLAACVLILAGCAGPGGGTGDQQDITLENVGPVTEEDRDDLIRYLDKDYGTDRDLRIQAYKLLAKLGDPRALPVLRERLEKAEETRSKEEYRVCAYAIEKCGGRSQEERMDEWSRSRKPSGWTVLGVLIRDQIRPVPGSPLTIAWWRERLLDVTDVFGIRFSAGPGLLVHAQATKIAQAGAGGYRSTLRAGYKDRRAGLWWQDSAEFGISLAYLRAYRLEPIHANFEGGDHRTGGIDVRDVWDRRFLDVGGAVHAGVVGADVWFNTSQFLDLVIGFFNYDLIDDDAILEGPRKNGWRTRVSGQQE